jgi:hypothetical protein
VFTFLRAPSQEMESLAADRKSMLDLVPMSFTLLIKHCDYGEAALNAVDQKLTAAGMKDKFLAVDSVGLGDRRGCDECKELLESEQWLAL